MDRGGLGPAVVVERLLAAINAHDLEAMVACFADDYVNEWPAHPQRGFQGRAQVRQNWSQIFAGVPNLQARLPRMAVDGDTVWTEWDISGTRGDGAAFLMRGVSIFGVADGRLAWVCSYLSLALLAGVGLYALFGWWWADSVGALAMLPVILWQGWETLGEAREHEDEEGQ